MISQAPNTRYVARKRRTQEDKRFVTGRGVFVQDIERPGMLHVAALPCPYPRARINNIDFSAALAMPGVHAVLDGAELAAATNPLYGGLKTPGVKWRPLAFELSRYAGEWVAAVAADSRAIAEDAMELIEVDYTPTDPVIDPEEAYQAGSPQVHPEHGSNVLYDGEFTWGPVDDDFAAADHSLSFRARWHRSSTVPIETFGAVAEWDEGKGILDVWASIQMPNYADQIAGAMGIPLNAVRVHQDVDVGGSYGVKRGIKHTVLIGYLSRKLERPIRLIEDRLDNMGGGDAHGPDRIFDTQVAYNADGMIKSLKIRALDDAGAYPGRGPFQLGKPIAAIVGPYTINSVHYEAISVTTNKTGQVPVRGFGQAPTNYMLERAVDKVAAALGMDRIEIRRRNFIQPDQFPYEQPSGTKYDSGNYPAVMDKVLALANFDALCARRDEIRSEGRLAGIGVATCLEPGGGNNMFEYLMNPAAEITTFMEGAEARIDGEGCITGVMATTTSGQGHETLVATILGEELGREPDDIRVIHADTLTAMPTRSPVASRMAIMLGGAITGAAAKLKAQIMAIAAHNLETPLDQLEYSGGDVSVRNDPSRKLTWNEICYIAHKQYHRLPEGAAPGLQAQHVWQVPLGGQLPDADGKVQLYPCFSFQAHIPLVEIDPGTGKVTLLEYFIAHDCGTVINPDIVRGMILGGIAHGIGAALYEKFEYAPDGQFLSATFADYLMPSTFEVPLVKDTEHCTPSPLTSHGQKGSGEGGYLGGPAAVASAVNDALSPRGLEIDQLPMRMSLIEELLNGTP
ncbi:MAG: xanthine dehydrogenase family protein [Rhodospirillaceae bacterium]|jgi:2-furoyl-CoA dehydrogenase large subunit|nr:xanthine dehydrogenase family protein [Rhodospirillaceae bacterium]MBT4670953.1 xanthine dehydrogenase family protein [Rhodospirillaceae bacterium]MBT4749667.1 xanthine dehydrogenase family protein [Rhodospirillaceae bacterium]MBT5180468.1 xanthine dehydrogenase family protein [Rhodospirillaceae bacterium]MBT5838412.1 xanthine dehydrogenase family protein [Rhodospirillaceae bacterium]